MGKSSQDSILSESYQQSLGKTSQIFRLGSTNLKGKNAGIDLLLFASRLKKKKGVKTNVGCPRQ